MPPIETLQPADLHADLIGIDQIARSAQLLGIRLPLREVRLTRASGGLDLGHTTDSGLCAGNQAYLVGMAVVNFSSSMAIKEEISVKSRREMSCLYTAS